MILCRILEQRKVNKITKKVCVCVCVREHAHAACLLSYLLSSGCMQ